MTDTTFAPTSVPGISCGHCKAAIEAAVATVAGVDAVEVDVAARTVRVEGGRRTRPSGPPSTRPATRWPGSSDPADGRECRRRCVGSAS